MAEPEPGGDQKWKRFEKAAARIQKALAPGARVEHNVRIDGKESRKPRQDDIGVWTKAGQYDLFIAIDCKDYGEPVDVKDVEAFVGIVRDIRANQGAMIAAQGYTDGARNVAESAGLRLFTLVDTESKDWPAFVSIPAVLVVSSIGSYAFSISSTELAGCGKTPVGSHEHLS